MKILHSLSHAALAILLYTAGLPLSAHADVTAGATSDSSSNSAAGAAAYNGGIVFESGADHMKYSYGTQKIKNTPGVILGGFSNSFAQDYCGGTAQAGVSIAGFGTSAGKPVFDETCQILRAVEKTANLAQQRLAVDGDQARKLLRATDLLMCKALKGVTDVAFTKAGIDCGDAPATPPAEEKKQAAAPKNEPWVGVPNYPE